jgi:heme-degrading monooxygenase HmoA
MYTRVVEVTSKSGRARELCNTIDDKVLPILRRQAGFVDETVMVSDTEPNRVFALSLWNTREDAQRYEREQFDAVQKIIQHLLETEPTVRTFDVHSSTAHKVTAKQAA